MSTKLKPKFKAPNGVEFDSKIEYRNYMMENYLSVKGKRDNSFMKNSGM